MSEIGDEWREHRAYLRRKRLASPDHGMQTGPSRDPDKAAMAQVRRAKIEVVQMKNPYHCRVAGKFDWWPNSGKWRAMDGSHAGSGTKDLIAAVRVLQQKDHPHG